MSGDPRPDDPLAILERALARAPEERPAYLDEVCAGRPELRQRVEALLAESDQETRVLDPDPDAPTKTVGADPGTPTRVAGDPMAGSTIAQYVIGARIGSGGMGVVYEAKDTRLHREVALKFLSLALSDNRAARRRFFAEARAASALDHPNLCTVHEIGETPDGTVYIVMARYHGETLAKKLARGPLPLEIALDYATQIAGGLAAAHRRGVLHRDLKPANVMLTEPAPAAPHGVAKILDFGIAKIEGVDLTRAGVTMGTTAYASPEQARGGKVDVRSDIWSLGVMLYEMVTGQRPFQGGTELALLQALTRKKPAPPSQHNEELSPELEKVVLRCLEKDPAKRYSTVDELLVDLAGCRTAMTTAALTMGGRAPTRPSPQRRLVVGAMAAALLTMALAIPPIRDLWLRPLLDGEKATRLVAVLPLRNNLGPEAENEALVAGLTHSLTGLVARLGAGGGALWIVPTEELSQRGVASASEARRLFGVDTVLTGSVQSAGARTEIVINLVDAELEPPRTVDSRSIAAPLSPALRDLALAELATLFGVAGAADGERYQDATTSSGVYALYLQGVGYLERFDRAGSLPAAIRAFEQAASEDPSYAPAHAGLCQARWDRFRQTEERTLAELAASSCRRAAELGADQAPVLVSVGRSYYQQGELTRARAELERALELDPENAEAHRWLGWVEDEEGRVAAAEAAFRRAIELEPRLWVLYNDLGIVLTGAGRHQEAALLFQRSLELTPESYLAHNALAVAKKNLGDVTEAERLLRRSIELQPNPLAYRNLGNLFYRQGEFQRAVEILEEARDLHGESPSFNDWVLWSWLAHAYHWAGDRQAAEDAWRRLIEIAEPVYQVNPRDADSLMLLADAHVALGDRERGQFFLNRLLALRIEANYTRFYIGRTYEMLGDRELALDYLQQALEGGFDPLMVDRDPWLEGLRTEPAYGDLRERYVLASGAAVQG